MKKQIFRHTAAILLLCVLILQACPVSASDGVRIHTTEVQSAALSSYDFQAAKVDFSTSHKYRDQLATEDQKALYELFVRATPTNNTITLQLTALPALPSVSDPAFQAELGAYLSELVLPSYAAAVQDTPMLFWTGQIGYSCSYGILGTELVSVTLHCSVVPNENISAENYDSMQTELLRVLDSLSFQAASRMELLRQFHDYLCKTATYRDSANAHNIYGALINGEAVCEGYAKTFKLFCDLYGIPCMLITGDAVTENGTEAHAWNAVRMENGNWYAVDVTWDDQGDIYYDFFLIGSQSVPESFMKLTFEESHIAEGDFYGNGAVRMDFPTLAENVYTYTNVIGDCNGDGVCSGKDAVRLLQYLASCDPVSGTCPVQIGQGADCNGDGTIDGRDATRLLRYLADLDPVTGESSVTLGK